MYPKIPKVALFTVSYLLLSILLILGMNLFYCPESSQSSWVLFITSILLSVFFVFIQAILSSKNNGRFFFFFALNIALQFLIIVSDLYALFNLEAPEIYYIFLAILYFVFIVLFCTFVYTYNQPK